MLASLAQPKACGAEPCCCVYQRFVPFRKHVVLLHHKFSVHSYSGEHGVFSGSQLLGLSLCSSSELLSGSLSPTPEDSG